MRKLLLGLTFVIATLLYIGSSTPAKANGYWTDFSLAGQTPWCGGGTCPTLFDSCMSASYSWWQGEATQRLLDCQMQNNGYGLATVAAYCCGAVYYAHPALSCSTGMIADLSIPTGCRKKDDEDCFFCAAAAGGSLPSDAPMEGNPMVVSAGGKVDRFVDFTTTGPNALSFVRAYSSHSRATLGLRDLPLGNKWFSNFDIFLWSASASDYNTMFALRPGGSTLQFTLSGSNYVAPTDRPLKLVKTSTTFELTDTADTKETYDLAGNLKSIVRRNGYTQTLAYDGNGKLQTVTDSYGRVLTFAFSGDRLATLTAPDGTVYRYLYDKSISATYQQQPDRLIGAVYPRPGLVDGGAAPQVTYLYENSAYPLWLTGITDEKGVRYATWSYDSDGRAVSSQHAGGVDLTTLAFNVDDTVTATRPLGKQIIYSFTTIAGRPHVTSIAQQATTNTPTATETRTYDTNGFISSRTDFKGNVTNYVLDAHGLETSRTEAYGTSLARTISTTWHSTFHLPTEIVAPGKTTDFTYDSAGRVLTETETDTRTQTVPYSTNGQTRTWAYTWDSTGLLQTINGPRTDVTDTTTYSWTNGVLTSVTNALGQVTQINAVNERGLPTELTDANGVVTDLAYNLRGWLTSVIKRRPGGDAITSFEYDVLGQITAITEPDGMRLTYEYDDARRLTAVQDSLGERIEYTLDAMGNRTAETIKASVGSIVKSMTRTYDEVGRLLHSIGASSQTTAYAYDKNDNVTGITDPLSGVTAQAYDALDRVISSTDPATKVTAYGYDNQDHLTSVTDARSVQTAYVYDGFGRVIQAVTPDGGTTVYHYDPADNLTEKTDGRSVVTDYSYDALNRITAKTFAAATSENVAYSYDDSASGHFGIGRLATITDESGSTAFIYDSRGNVVQETRTIAGTAYVTGYAYDVADRLTQMTYPSGRIVAYARDTLGRVTAVTTQASAADAPATIASNIAYKPFGPIASMLYGNGLTRTYTYDGDYRLTALATGDVDTSVQDLSYGYDAADNITSIADALASDRSQAFTYDSLFRLKTAAATGTYGSIAYNYDDIGNRTSVVDGAGTESYSTDTSSNRLLSTTSSSGTRSFTYDNAGNITADATGSTTYGLAYNKANRLSEVSLNGTPDTDYLYNALGERVKKAPAATPTAGTRFHYDRDGKLIAESDSTGAVIREYAWLDGLPIGEFTNAGAGTPPGKTQLDDSDSGATFTGSWTTTTAGSGYIGSSYHKFDPSSGGAPAGGTVIDNTSPQFSTLGAWATATSPTGFEGSDYRVRNAGVDGFGSDLIVDNADATGFATTGTWSVGTYFENYNGNFVYKSANGLTPEVTIVDNTDTTHVQQTGGWTVANDCCGHYNGDSLQHTPNQPLTGAIVVDNGSAQSSFTGTWSSYYIGNGQTVGSDFAYKYVPDGTSTYTWTPSLPAAGQYRVYAHWYAWSGNATNAPYTIYYDGGSTVVQVNQQSNGGTWNLLGTFAMTPGQNQRVMMTQQGNGQIIADAIEFAPVAAPPNQVTWTPDIPQSADYSVYAWWKGWQANAAATYTIYHGSGSTSVTVNQNNNGAQWNLLGVFPLAPGQNHRVVLTDVSSDYQQILADAVRLIRVGAPPPSAIWTPTLPARDRYDVSAKWYNYPYQATNAPFTVYHEAGSTTVAEDEANGDASWHLLGTFVMAPGENHRVVLTDVANGGVTGDAVKLSAHHEAKLATWSIPGSAIAQTGNYMVYAKWPALPGTGATDATYTVSYQGGSQSVSVNQRANGGQWNLLGQFAFSAGGSGYKVDLADSANGKVAADAIYIVQSGAPAGAAFTWTPPFPSAGAYQVYARWPGSSANTAAAQYTVTRDGGTSTVTLNQKQNGGAWMLLGNYNFTPSSGQKVMLAASSDGTTIADAMLFVGAGAQPANLLYVHADHLGSPQKMTDASQAIAWDGVFDPFGKEVAITGLAAMPKRFPGQYADDETGYSYNLLRYYDPTIARYLQRDPIGLAGGINGYGYASGNPIRRFDPTGEMSVGGSSGGAVLIGMTAAVLAAIACEATSQMQQQYYDHHRFHLPRIPNIGDLIPGVRPWLWNENANGDGTSSPGDPPANGGSGGQGGSTTDQGGSGGQGGAQNGQDAANTATDGSTPGKSSSSEQYNKGGGAGQANSDFDKIAGNNNPVKDHGNGIRSTELQDGTTVSVRPSSSEGSPTVQINRPGEPPIKVRYK